MLAAGTRLGPYIIQGGVGAGGMGEVYRARDTRLERDVAIKILPERLFKSPEALKRFQREAKTLAALSHPNILSIYDIGEQEGLSFAVMELLEGETLRRRIAHAPPSCEQAIEIITAVIQGLIAAHSAGIIHRDLKPENIFITRDERVKILDFGLAKKIEAAEDIPQTDKETLSQATVDGVILGTIPYMSPEQARGDPLDPKSDIFSTGIVLYELLTGHLPFQGPNVAAVIHKIIHENSPPPSTVRPGVPKWVDPVVQRALEKQKENRYSTSTELLKDLKKSQEMFLTGKALASPSLHKFKSPAILIPVLIAILAIILSAFWFMKRQEKIRWAKTVALPQIKELMGSSWRDSTEAYRIAEEAEKYMRGDPELATLFSKLTVKINVRTTPAGAKVYMKEYKTPDAEWKYLGLSPLENIRLPYGIFRWKLEKEGYETVLAAATSFNVDVSKENLIVPFDIARILDEKKSIPPGMVRVSGAETVDGKVEDYFFDRYEVTNRQFKQFVAAGGYTKKEYWKQDFVEDGKPLTREEALARFVDQSQQPGPSSWLGGDFPEGQGDYPVSGVSWYEAAAYAEFSGKSLPTEKHWYLAMGSATPLIQYPQMGGAVVFAPFSNFERNSSIPAGSLPGITSYGAFDMAGNVREWCWNQTPKGRLLRGGAWGDNLYMMFSNSQAPPMDRSIKNGIRCAIYPHPERIHRAVFEPIRLPATRDYYKEKPVPDSVFQVYKDQFAFDKTPLNAKVESKKENADGWSLEKITFDAAYGSERVTSYLFLPANSRPPYQTVIYFPGSASYWKDSSTDIESYYEFPLFLSYLVKNGRAVVYPVYKGTFERKDASLSAVVDGNESHLFTDLVMYQVKDFKRCLDYLETRKDIDHRKFAYYGMSGGGWFGAIIPAVEDRLQVSVLIAGGFIRNPVRPEADQFNYLTHVKVPTLMMNGKYDTIFPYELSIRPMFDLLGTPLEQKVLKLYDTDHIPPRNEFIKETLAWLDRYLGPVAK